MSSKTVLYESKDTRLRYDIAVALHNIADSIAEGALQIKDTFGSVCVSVDNEVKYEVEVQEKVKGQGVKRSVEIELSWTEELPEQGEGS